MSRAILDRWAALHDALRVFERLLQAATALDIHKGLHQAVTVEQKLATLRTQLDRLTIEIQCDTLRSDLQKRQVLDGRVTQARRTFEKATLEELLAKHHGNQSKVARELGLTQPGLYHHLLKLGIRVKRTEE